MLVLWDSTYISRLWCIFELAAFLQDEPGQHDRLFVRPVTLGPCTLGVYLTVVSYGAMRFIPNTTWSMRLCLQSIPAFLAIHVFRNYAHSVHTLEQKLKVFSMGQTECACCAINHVHPGTGAQILCDRSVVVSCIRSWFGRVSTFQGYVRSYLGDVLGRQLGIQCAFPYSWTLFALSPVLWAEMDVVSAVSRTGSSEQIAAQVLTGFLTAYLCIFPFMMACVCKLAKLLRYRCISYSLDLIVSLGGASVLMVLISCVWILHRILLQHLDSCVVSELCFLVISSMLAFGAWGLLFECA